ncbi:nucleotidyltransferase family protein [Niallia sp. XMNu-256]|uniref:nucleotidyltransferase domain-containing protein n=1 Tax=Niallia sp. XMNu-256 TaxID=3082444 RepID=UPI0030CD5268
MNNDYCLNLSTVSKELNLLLELMRVDNEPIHQKWLPDIEWEILLQLARHHRVYPMVYSKLKNIDGIPSFVLQTLYKEYKLNTFKMLALSKEMEQLSKLFTENHIPLLFLKGPVIAAHLYGDLSLRTSKDLDILIQIKHIERVEEILIDLGYEKEPVLSVLPFVLNDWKWGKHHIVYYHPQKQMMLEIHWRLEPFPSKEPSFNELWERKRVSVITNEPVYFLGEEDLFTYLVSHGARHGWFRLRWLLDIDKMLRKGLDIEKSIQQLKQYHRGHVGGQALILTSELLRTPIEGDLKELTERSDARKLAQHSMEFINGMESIAAISSTKSYKRYRWSMNKADRFFKGLLLFYPNYADVQTFKLPKYLHLLYFPLRPFLMVVRKIRKRSLRHKEI